MTVRWNQTTRRVVAVLLVALSVALLWYLRELFFPLVLAGFLAYLLNPLVDYVDERTPLPRSGAVTLVFLVVLVVVVLLAALLLPDLVAQLRDSSEELQRSLEAVEALIAALEAELRRVLPAGLAGESGDLGIQLLLADLVQEIQLRINQTLQAERMVVLVQSTTNNVVWALVTLVTAFYLLKDWARLRDWLFGLAPRASRRDVRRLYVEVRRVWQLYLRGQLRLMIFVGGLCVLGGLLVGLPGAVLLGVMAGVLDIIPSLGPTIAMVLATIVAFAVGSTILPISTFWFAVLVLGIYAAIQLVENIWLRPQIMGSSVRLHPGVVFVAFFTAIMLSGIVLALLIVPLVGTAFVVGRYVRCRMLGIPPWDGDVPTQPALPEMDEAAEGGRESGPAAETVAGGEAAGD